MPEYTPSFATALKHVASLHPALHAKIAESTFPAFYTTNKTTTAFEYLTRSIISQQVSGFAAKAILDRFLSNFSSSFPVPKDIIDADITSLREAGLSARKVEYIKTLASSYEDGTLSEEKLTQSSDGETVDLLVSLRGIGPWTAQMFLMFYLKRLDVMSPGDVGIQNGYCKFLEEAKASDILKSKADFVYEPLGASKKATAVPKLPETCRTMLAVSENFKPYRTVFCLVMWKFAATSVGQLEAEAEARELEAKKPEAKRKAKPARNPAKRTKST